MVSTPYSLRAASLNSSGYGSSRWITYSKNRGENEEPLMAKVQLEGQPVFDDLPQQNLRYLNYAEKSRHHLGAHHEFQGLVSKNFSKIGPGSSDFQGDDR